MIALVTALGGVWSVEQPSGSVLEFYPAWRFVTNKIFEHGGDHAVSCFKVFLVLVLYTEMLYYFSSRPI